MRTSKQISILFVLMLFYIGSFAQQDSSLVFLKNIPGNYSYFTADNLNNLYLVDNNNRLKKLNSNGDSVGVFNEVKKHGTLSLIDASNPLKILLFYKNYSTVVILDRFLNVRNTINLRKKNIFKVNAITTSYDNNIWLFDEVDGKLKKIGEEGETISETIDMRVVLDNIPSPVMIKDQDGFVYLYDSTKGFYTFDYYGGFKNKMAFLHWKNADVLGKTFLGITGDTLHQYTTGSMELKQYILPPAKKQTVQTKIAGNKLYMLNEDGIDVYEIK